MSTSNLRRALLLTALVLTAPLGGGCEAITNFGQLPGWVLCGTSEVNLTTDPRNCGACGQACGPNEQCATLDGSTNPAQARCFCGVSTGQGISGTWAMNAGQHACILPYAAATNCESGLCSVETCVDDATGRYADCVASVSGCETNVLTGMPAPPSTDGGVADAGVPDAGVTGDAGAGAQAAEEIAHCGACNRPCSGANSRTNLCVDGNCSLDGSDADSLPDCLDGWADCDGEADNGCETNIDTDAMNCGDCTDLSASPVRDFRCQNDHALPFCFAGLCRNVICDPGYGDCDGDTDNGCEQRLDVNSHCGGCYQECAPSNVERRACIIPVADGTVTDPDSNGDGVPDVDPTAISICSYINRQVSSDSAVETDPEAGCRDGYSDCDSVASNGCEASLNSSSDSCGACEYHCAMTMCFQGNCARGVTHVRAGTAFTCAFEYGGEALCWGSNSRGQIGDGSSVDVRGWPASVLGPSNPMMAGDAPLNGVVDLATGAEHACAIAGPTGMSPEIVCWGDNAHGQLGDDLRDATDPTLSSRVVKVRDLPMGDAPAQVVAGEGHSCALTVSGAVYCWGDNTLGQLGIGSADTSRNAAVRVTGITGAVTQITAGGSHTCALTAAGAVYCWGDNSSGQLGDGGTTQRRSPQIISLAQLGATDPMSGGRFPVVVQSLAAGTSHTCAAVATVTQTPPMGEMPQEVLTIACWGANDSGQVGVTISAMEESATPVSDMPALALGGSTMRELTLALGGAHSCFALTEMMMGGGPPTVTTACWGSNSAGQLGRGTVGTDISRLGSPLSSVAVPITETYITTDPMRGIEHVGPLASGGSHSCVVLDQGYVYCWGDDSQSQIAYNGTDSLTGTSPRPAFGMEVVSLGGPMP